MKIKKILAALAVLSLAGSCFAHSISYQRVLSAAGDSVFIPAKDLPTLIEKYLDPGHANMGKSGFFTQDQITAFEKDTLNNLQTYWGINANSNAANVNCNDSSVPQGVCVVYADNAQTSLIGWYFHIAENWPLPNPTKWPVDYYFLARDSANPNREGWLGAGFGSFLFFFKEWPFGDKVAQPGNIFVQRADVFYQSSNSNPNQVNFDVITAITRDNLGSSYVDALGNAGFALYATALDSSNPPKVGEYLTATFTEIEQDPIDGQFKPFLKVANQVRWKE